MISGSWIQVVSTAIKDALFISHAAEPANDGPGEANLTCLTEGTYGATKADSDSDMARSTVLFSVTLRIPGGILSRSSYASTLLILNYLRRPV